LNSVSHIAFKRFFKEWEEYAMKPATTIAAILFLLIATAHLLRLIFHVPIIAGGITIPMWPSLVAFIIPALVAVMLWRENKR